MRTVILLVATLAAQDPSRGHVRASEPKIRALIDQGLVHSSTFRRLVEILDRSDVILNIEPTHPRTGLSAYLAHTLVTSGGYRYLRISVEAQGTSLRLVAILGHELQHAVEVAQAPDVRDAESLVRMFKATRLNFGCASSRGECYETKAAQDIEAAVLNELKASRVTSSRGRVN